MPKTDTDTRELVAAILRDVWNVSVEDAQGVASRILEALAASGTRAGEGLSAEELRALLANAMRKDGVTKAVMTITPTGVITAFEYGTPAPEQPDAVAEAYERCAQIAERDMTPAYGKHNNAMEYLAETQRKNIAAAIRSAKPRNGVAKEGRIGKRSGALTRAPKMSCSAKARGWSNTCAEGGQATP